MPDELYRYDYWKASTVKKEGALLLSDSVYVFITKKDRKYLVHVELYKYNVYILKFHLKEHRLWKHRYNVRTHDYDGIRILNTCLHICLELLKRDKYASFGFIGARTFFPELKSYEPETKTKRFRVYSMKAVNNFSPDNFSHEYIDEKSAYLLLNKRNSTPKLKEKIEAMFNELYLLDNDSTPIPTAIVS